MTTGCKVWLWIVLISNVISVLSGLATMAIITIVGGIVNCTGASLLLFSHKKVGFYLLTAVAVVMCVVNISAGIPAFAAIIPAVVSPLITYFFVRKNADIIQ